MTDISEIQASRQAFEASLARANYDADLREWKRYEADTKEKVKQWSAAEVRAMLDQVIRELSDEAQEKREQQIQEEFERSMKHKPYSTRTENV